MLAAAPGPALDSDTLKAPPQQGLRQMTIAVSLLHAWSACVFRSCFSITVSSGLARRGLPIVLMFVCGIQEQLAVAAARSTQAKSLLQSASSAGDSGQPQLAAVPGKHGKTLVLPNGHHMPDSVKVIQPCFCSSYLSADSAQAVCLL
jgi:hypothetical protein